MKLKARVLVPGLLIPGGGYVMLGAWRQGLAFLSIGILVAALWTDLFTEFRFGVLLFWGVLAAAGILGADQVSRQNVPHSLGVAWIINGSLIFVATGLVIGGTIGAAGVLVVSDADFDFHRALQLLVVGELTAYGVGGLVLGWFAPRPVRTAVWSAIVALGWAFVRGVGDRGVEATFALLGTRWPHLLALYGLCIVSAGVCALIAGLTARRDAIAAQSDAAGTERYPAPRTPPPSRPLSREDGSIAP